MMDRMVLDLGAGINKYPGAISVDSNPVTEPDVLHNLNELPYPFKTSSIDEVRMDNVLEHVDDVVAVLTEIYRISKSNAVIIIAVPYFRARWAFIDPTHKHFFTVDSMTYFDPKHENSILYPYSSAKFSCEKLEFNGGLINGKLKSLVIRFANRLPGAYERCISHLYPLDQLTFTLKVDK